MKRHWEAQHEVILNVLIKMKEWLNINYYPKLHVIPYSKDF